MNYQFFCSSLFLCCVKFSLWDTCGSRGCWNSLGNYTVVCSQPHHACLDAQIAGLTEAASRRNPGLILKQHNTVKRQMRFLNGPPTRSLLLEMNQLRNYWDFNGCMDTSNTFADPLDHFTIAFVMMSRWQKKLTFLCTSVFVAPDAPLASSSLATNSMRTAASGRVLHTTPKRCTASFTVFSRL